MKVGMLALLFCFCGSLFAQTTTVVISDNNGNQTTGTIRDGNLYFYDSQGNTGFGTIRNGSVYMNGNHGEYLFGTLGNGNVFLTDQNGNTTGTIRAGHIFLNNSDGSTTTGTYDGYGHIYTTTTPSVQEQEQQQRIEQQQQQEAEERQRQLDQQNYEAGQQFGNAVGSAIVAGIENHRVKSYCNSNPTSSVRTADGLVIDCPNAPLDSWAQDQITTYCADNPGSYMLIGLRRVDCLTPPNPVNLTWAIWELKNWRWDYDHHAKLEAKMNLSSDQMRSAWEHWRGVFCTLAPGAEFKNLKGKKQHCN
jgi:hypothetical protein